MSQTQARKVWPHASWETWPKPINQSRSGWAPCFNSGHQMMTEDYGHRAHSATLRSRQTGLPGSRHLAEVATGGTVDPAWTEEIAGIWTTRNLA
ncbi:unnamed protein product [Protopolystoma xenopodis]|uniref:Uncharacterized protein n=1 Tax=Protopolystoma xenopodis TaxID=117903 RepID=A0A3S5ASJ0_9PLAT|nr:unnamed protein product [Protopolystoma xenopodis]